MENITQEGKQPRALPLHTGIEQYPLYNKSLALCVLIAHKTKKFPRMFKYDLGTRSNAFATEMFVNIMDGLGTPISQAKIKLELFNRAYNCLKYINGLLTVANCLECISDREKGVIDENIRDVANQLRKTSNGLIKKMNADVGSAAE